MSRTEGFPQHDWGNMTVSEVRDAWGKPRAEDAFDYADMETLIQGVELIRTMEFLEAEYGNINVWQALTMFYNAKYAGVRVEIGSKLNEETDNPANSDGNN